MRLSATLRTAALAAFALAAADATAYAGSGTISIKIVEAGLFIGGSAGSGTLTYGDKSYALSIGGISAGLVAGAAEVTFSGTANNLSSVDDIAGIYAAAGAGVAADRGKGVIALTNPKGVLLELSGKQRGLMLNVDLSGMAISLK